jgi:hypothetical protein
MYTNHEREEEEERKKTAVEHFSFSRPIPTDVPT